MSKSSKGSSGGIKCYLYSGNADITLSEEINILGGELEDWAGISLEAGVGGLTGSTSVLREKIGEVAIF